MTDHLPFGPATAVGEIAPELSPPPVRVEPLPRPRSPEDEPRPFTARAAEWLVAYV